MVLTRERAQPEGGAVNLSKSVARNHFAVAELPKRGKLTPL